MKIENSVIEDSLLEAQYILEGAEELIQDMDTWLFVSSAVLHIKKQYYEFRKENG